MSSFLFAFHQPPGPLSPAQADALMAKGQVWLEGIARSVTGPLTPLGKSVWLGCDGADANETPAPLAGFMIVEAQTVEHVVDMASSSPHLDVGGIIEIAPVLDLDFNSA
ncbi:hypothetical protein [Novosphingobium sp. Gsoil 351]|uniref:hypothetical protein n=1 Tax=Novosphingobium sp. Gsoil 351 TaxID=2675225 RepID=UPI0012B4A86A|nr:hypothetical protein [Novosphingobium sp. Gsoil 351]QGN55404.1 hypothetical protein GKE62_13465 [Novosphingobium sp. Gsoil 351]